MRALEGVQIIKSSFLRVQKTAKLFYFNRFNLWLLKHL